MVRKSISQSEIYCICTFLCPSRSLLKELFSSFLLIYKKARLDAPSLINDIIIISSKCVNHKKIDAKLFPKGRLDK